MRYSDHAEERMNRYGIARVDVEAIIARPTRGRYAPLARDRVEHFGVAADGRPFNVVTNRAETIIITVVPE